jgi:PAS domain S-box-containing protein
MEEGLEKRMNNQREMKDYLDNIIKSSADAIVVVDMEGIVRSWNKAAEDYMGYTADEVIGKSNRKFFADPEEADRIMDLVMREGELKNYRTIVLSKNKKPVHISMSAALLKDKNGVPIGTVRVSRDITKEVQLERKIKEERDNLNLIFDTMVDGVYIVSKDYKVEFMNKVLIDDFEDQVGGICYEVFHNREEPCPLCKNTEVLNGKTVRWEWHSRRKNKMYDLIEAPLKNSDDTLSKLTIFRDITERKRVEEALRKSEEKYHNFLENLADGVFVLDHAWRYVFVNDAACGLVQLTRNELLGNKITDLFPGIEHTRFFHAYKNTMETGHTNELEAAFPRPDGTQGYYNVRASVVPEGIVVVARDVTDRKRVEEELKKHMKELERANRDLEDFTSTVSHDLKVPLRSLQAFSLLLVEDYATLLDDVGREYLIGVKGATERMEALIEDLLKLSRVGRKFTEVESVDLNELLEEIYSDLSARIEERGGELVVAGNLPTLSTERVWMKELFMNLIDNGLKFNKSEKPRVEVNGEEREKDYLFKVKDNGIGIEEKYQAHIFNLFERVHSAYEYGGTGAGLAICKKIVKELGGDIWVESKSGEGSTFCFTIPRN